MPVFLKKDMEDQLPSIKKSNLKNEAYAQKSIQQLFSADLLDKAIVKKINYTSSCVAINNGNGNFTIQKLPAMEQLSCINAIYCADLNGDGYVDLVTGGNQFGFMPQFERLDASLGDVLINNGKGEFAPLTYSETGLCLLGDIRNLITIKGKDNLFIVAAKNNEAVQILKRSN